MFIFLMCHVLKMVYSYFVSLIYIKLDVVEIIEREKERIANDPELRYLVGREGEVLIIFMVFDSIYKPIIKI